MFSAPSNHLVLCLQNGKPTSSLGDADMPFGPELYGVNNVNNLYCSMELYMLSMLDTNVQKSSKELTVCTYTYNG